MHGTTAVAYTFMRPVTKLRNGTRMCAMWARCEWDVWILQIRIDFVCSRMQKKTGKSSLIRQCKCHAFYFIYGFRRRRSQAPWLQRERLFAHVRSRSHEVWQRWRHQPWWWRRLRLTRSVSSGFAFAPNGHRCTLHERDAVGTETEL